MKLNLSDISPKVVTAVVVIFLGGLAVMLVLGLILRPRLLPEVPPAIATTTPTSHEENVLGTLPVTLVFQQELEEDRREKISVTIQPSAGLTARWAAANKLQLTPAQPLQAGTSYIVSVSYEEDPIYTFSFRTADISSAQLAEDIRQQAEGDELFAEGQKEWYQDNPWYGGLPIVISEYTIVYDFEKESFRIRITLGSGTSDAQIETAKQEALNDLKQIGVDTNTQGYYFIIE